MPFEERDDWSAGVITASEPDRLPPIASPRGLNSALVSVGPERAVPTKRPGLIMQNSTAVPDAPQILGMHQLRLSTGETYRLLVSSHGRLDKLVNGAVVNLTQDLVPGIYYPSAADALDFTFFANGVDQRKTNGTVVYEMGMVRPDAPTAAEGSSGNMSGDFDIAITFGNAQGGESSRSDEDTLTGVVSKQLVVTWTDSTDPQVTTVYVHIRKRSIQVNYYRAATIAVGVGTATLDLTDAQLTALIIKAPGTTTNDPPPSDTKYLAWWGNRMFISDGSVVYYSQLGQPGAFDLVDNVELVNQDDGKGGITGIRTGDGELIIFKREATYHITDPDPASWTVEVVDPQIGATANRSCIYHEGYTYFWSEQGPMRRAAGIGPAEPIGQLLIAPSIGPDAIDYTTLDDVCACASPMTQRILFGVTALGDSRNSTLIPFNYRIKGWESTAWTPMDVGALATMDDDEGVPQAWLGNYAGRTFSFHEDRAVDGVPTGTVQGAVTLGTTAFTALTDTNASFYTEGDGLNDLYLYLVEVADPTNITRVRITSNTATVITIPSTTVSAAGAYNYYLGAINFQWDIGWMNQESGFTTKRYDFFHIAGRSLSATAPTINIDFFYDLDDELDTTSQVNFGDGAGTQWDMGVFDVDVWGAATSTHLNERVRLYKIGTALLARVRHIIPNQTFTLLRIGITSALRRLGVSH